MPSLPCRIAYDLVVQSEIELPELLIAPPERLRREVDVHIRIQPVDPAGIKGGKPVDDWLWITAQELWMDISDVARFLIRDGREILIDPVPGVDEESIRVFLLGSAFGALLFQRGFLVLHGNAIQLGNQCMICVGDSGAGKSTLAAGLMKRGYPILTDDVVPVDAQCKALPGFPRIKLWQETADRLGISTQGLRRIRPDIEKFDFPLGQQFVEESLPIRWIYVLESHDRPDFLLESIQGMARFAYLYENTYRMSFLEGMELKPVHLKLCSELSAQIRLVKVTRPANGFELDALMDRIIGDALANP